MEEKQAWEQFWNSGRVEDYLRYHAISSRRQPAPPRQEQRLNPPAEVLL